MTMQEIRADQNTEDEKRPGFLRRVTGSFKSTPDPVLVTETKTRTCGF